jgi:hypothetical protein
MPFSVETTHRKENTMKPAKNGTQKSTKSATATGKESKGFTDEERAAITQRALRFLLEFESNLQHENSPLL